MTEQMTRGDRETLIKIAKQRARLAKEDAKARSAQLMAEFEMQLDRRYSFDENEVWEAASKAAQNAVNEAQAKITEECERLGIPAEFAPSLSMSWYSRGRNASKEERAEMRRVASAQVEAMQRTAINSIDRVSLETQEQIMIGGLTSDDAKRFLESMPTAEALMPAITVDRVHNLILESKVTKS